MIERLLAAEAALDKGMLDTAGRLFDQVARADPRNAIALVGLAKVALREDRIADARELVEQALAIDPDEAAAQRLLREVYGEAAAAEPLPDVERPAEAAAAFSAAQRRLLETTPAVRPTRPPSILARLRRWLSGRRAGS